MCAPPPEVSLNFYPLQSASDPDMRWLCTAAILRQPSIVRKLICPLATRLKSRTSAASSVGSEPAFSRVGEIPHGAAQWYLSFVTLAPPEPRRPPRSRARTVHLREVDRPSTRTTSRRTELTTELRGSHTHEKLPPRQASGGLARSRHITLNAPRPRERS